jgi:hypothetical protein
MAIFMAINSLLCCAYNHHCIPVIPSHVGHALLFYLLYPHLADKARVVIAASAMHDPAQKIILPDAKYTTAEELTYPTPGTAKSPGLQRYATSKLANITWT